ncbi:putative carboxypeptidase S1 [Lophiostoma macrostomum CBS 122681]|uniref:Putative carboxypeptidase S1 n=1 Tax=Lophiostoma macrostomum CBS 122681 TaxID=1314788 RepID=A0A6A6SQQ5_9PLEO|nr:putative carboxypeptidase S1 [Lophiostoma macrostomum CBS 122681]
MLLHISPFLFFTSALLSSRTYASPLGTDYLTVPYADDDGTHVIDSEVVSGAKISYKETHICETTPGVRAFSGYIHLPSSALEGYEGAQTYNASMFFWYFESRNDPKNSPLSLYVGGGPGFTSLGGATFENGPCFINRDSNSTTLNEWSWNNNVNMLYIDEPVEVGFSYESLIPSTLDQLTGEVTPLVNKTDIDTNTTFVAGTLPSQNPARAANTTSNAARIVWTSTQVFIQEFPEYDTLDSRVSLWTNSYGGHWGPGFMSHFITQNEKIQDGSIESAVCDPQVLNLDTLGMTNGCIDAQIEAPFYPEMAFNNTYGLQAISEDVFHESLNNLTKSGGCNDLITECRALAAASDPENIAANDTVNAACGAASAYCWAYVQGAFVDLSGRSPFDMSLDKLAVFPPDYIIGYMNQEWVQKELGAPLNFSISSVNMPDYYFGVTGDAGKVTIDAINYVASSGLKVALIYGDRDYRCNWLGGEAVSLAMEYPSSSSFRAAGYEALTTNNTYQGGVVRQHNSISFSRVFEAGHAAGAYQPETVSKIFDRVMFNKDVATGGQDVAADADYSSTGPESSFGIKNELPESAAHECYVWDILHTCNDEEIAALANGTAVVENYILTGIE